MIDKLFSWKDWDDVGDLVNLYFECHLLQPVAGFAEGCHFGMIQVDYGKGEVLLYHGEGDKKPAFRLKMNVTFEILRS